MSNERNDHLPATPALDALLARLKSRVTTQVWLHGLGTVLALACAWFLFAFLLDWWLHLPAAIRIVHLAVLIALPSFFLVRELVRPLKLRPDRAGLAVLIERAHPELKELFVSAVQFRDAGASASGEPELVARVMRDAEAVAPKLSLDRVLAPRGPHRRMMAGLLALALTLCILSWGSASASVFLARMAGGSTPWPQRTHLSIEVPVAQAPGAGPTSASSDAIRELVIKVARGSDVPVLVKAEGVVPDEVVLHFRDGHKAVLASAGGPLFRTLLRSLQEDATFHATGGDDADEVPSVHLVVLQPPDVAGIAVEITPPAYSGLPARIEFDRDVEVLAGSRIGVHVLCDPPSATGSARVLPEDRVLALVPAAFPRTTEEVTANAALKNGLFFELEPQKSVRYRFELKDDTGLSNPDPGLFGIAVVEDRAPEVEILSPGRGDFDTVPGGLVSLRARAEDDFGLAQLVYTIDVALADATSKKTTRPLTFELLPAETRDESEKGTRASRANVVRAAAIARERLEVAMLGAGEPVAEGQQFQIQVLATDTCAPTAHEGRSSPLRVRVVSTDEFLRRLQDRMARTQSTAAALGELQREKNRRAEELLAVLESDSPDNATGDLAAALTGQRRVQGDARALARELASASESVLYARIDERAGAALEMIDSLLSGATARGFDAAPWRELASAARDRGIAGNGLAGKLVDIVGLALEISEDLSQAATEELARASEAVDLPKVHDHLKLATENQKKTLAKIDALLERLAEWDNFQSVLALTRDILNGQKSLSDRTRQAAKEK